MVLIEKAISLYSVVEEREIYQSLFVKVRKGLMR